MGNNAQIREDWKREKSERVRESIRATAKATVVRGKHRKQITQQLYGYPLGPLEYRAVPLSAILGDVSSHTQNHFYSIEDYDAMRKAVESDAAPRDLPELRAALELHAQLVKSDV